jgi:two-component system cell cycle sensor histidine kinase/response regulator CckA
MLGTFTTKAGGTRLGLSTVYGFVSQSKGFILCLSNAGAGTTLAIDLPAVAEPAAEPPEAPPSPAAVPARSATIVLAEDEDVVRRLLREVLETEGYTVLEARGGEEAIALADAHDGAIDLLVTDLVMPGLGGRETAEALAESRPQTPVLYLSGYSEETVVASLNGDDHFLQKPFPPGVLVERVGELLRAAR